MIGSNAPSSQLESGPLWVSSRADKGWAVKRADPSKKVWCSGLGQPRPRHFSLKKWVGKALETRLGLGLCLEMSLVFDFGQGLRCGLSIRHCRCHWIMAAWFVFLHFFLVPLCWYAVSERQMLLNEERSARFTAQPLSALRRVSLGDVQLTVESRIDRAENAEGLVWFAVKFEKSVANEKITISCQPNTSSELRLISSVTKKTVSLQNPPF